jgi:hypothetical protein
VWCIPTSILLLVCSAQEVRVPTIQGKWWKIAGDAELGELTSPKQQPVDFGIWQAADGTWQLWSCIRNTKAAGKTRLFYRWEGAKLTDRDWMPTGIAMQANPKHGETEGGLQAPYVVKHERTYYLFYGDWEHICAATSEDGKTFTRRINPEGMTGMFGEGRGNNTRDPMVLRIGGLWYCYYTAYPKQQGAVYCRTSQDTRHWSQSRIVAFGGEAGKGPYSAECPFVVERQPGEYYLFRTQRYGEDAVTRVYRSRNPLDFGIDQDQNHLVATLPVAAPEIILHEGKYYIAALLPSLKGIQIAELEWVPK